MSLPFPHRRAPGLRLLPILAGLAVTLWAAQRIRMNRAATHQTGSETARPVTFVALGAGESITYKLPRPGLVRLLLVKVGPSPALHGQVDDEPPRLIPVGRWQSTVRLYRRRRPFHGKDRFSKSAEVLLDIPGRTLTLKALKDSDFQSTDLREMKSLPGIESPKLFDGQRPSARSAILEETAGVLLVRASRVSRRSSRSVSRKLRRTALSLRRHLSRDDALAGSLLRRKVLKRMLRRRLVTLAPEGDPGRDFQVVRLRQLEVPRAGPREESALPPADPHSRSFPSYIPLERGEPIRLRVSGPVRIRARRIGTSEAAPELEVAFVDAGGKIRGRATVPVCPAEGPTGRDQHRDLSPPQGFWALPSDDITQLRISGSPRLRLTFRGRDPDGRLAGIVPENRERLREHGRIARIEPSAVATRQTSSSIYPELPTTRPIPLGLPRRLYLLERRNTSRFDSAASYSEIRGGRGRLADLRPLASAELCYLRRKTSGEVSITADGRSLFRGLVRKGDGRIKLDPGLPPATNISLDTSSGGGIWLLNRRIAGTPTWVRRPAYLLRAGKPLSFIVSRETTQSPVRFQVLAYPVLPGTSGDLVVELRETPTETERNILVELLALRMRKTALVDLASSRDFAAIPSIGGIGWPISTGLTLGPELTSGRHRITLRLEGRGAVLVRPLKRL